MLNCKDGGILHHFGGVRSTPSGTIGLDCARDDDYVSLMERMEVWERGENISE